MRMMIASVLLVGGMAVMCLGLFSALSDIIGLYSAALDDPMAMDNTAEQDAATGIVRSVLIGLIGLPALVAGTVMLKLEKNKARLAARRAREGMHA